MQKLKSLLAVVLVMILAFSMAGCHPKDEVAVTVGGVDMTTSLYVCALIAADDEARSIVQENNSTVDASELDYYSMTVDGKKFTVWVKDRAIELCQRWAALELRMGELDLTLSDELTSNAEAMYSFYWSYYGLSAAYEPNGVSYDTYVKYSLMSEKEQTVFEYFYGVNGIEKMTDEEIDKAFLENYVLVYELDATYLDDTTSEEKKEMSDMFADFKTRMEAGESFETVKAEWDAYLAEDEETDDEEGTTSSEDATSSEDETSSEDTTSSETEEDTTPQPKDSNAIVIQSETAGGSDESFSTLHGMKTGEIKIIENSDGSGLRFIMKLDITADSYYRDSYYTPIAYILKGEEFEKSLADYAAGLEVNENKYATNRFTSKSIEENTNA